MNLLLLVVLIPAFAFALTFRDDHSSIKLFFDRQDKSIVLPSRLVSSPAYELRIKPSAQPQKIIVTSGGGGAEAANPLSRRISNTTKAKNSGPIDVSALLRRANKLFYRKKFKSAMILLDEAQKIDPENARVYSMKGSIYYTTGATADARRHWAKSLEKDPNQPDIERFYRRIEKQD